MGEKPTAAFVLSLIGGIFILLGGLLLAFAGSIVSSLNIAGLGNGPNPGTLLTLLGGVGAIIGLVVIVGGVMMYSNPGSHTMWGVIILVLSLVSWVTSVGGFVIGFLLALIGGILGIVFKPSVMQPAGMGSMPMRAQSMGPPPGAPMSPMTSIKCPACGATVAAGTTKCPNCGAML